MSSVTNKKYKICLFHVNISSAEHTCSLHHIYKQLIYMEYEQRAAVTISESLQS